MPEAAVEQTRSYESTMQGYFERFVQPDAPDLSYDEYMAWGVGETCSEPITLAPEPQVVPAPVVEHLPATQDEKRERSFRPGRVSKMLGVMAIGAVLSTAAVFGISEVAPRASTQVVAETATPNLTEKTPVTISTTTEAPTTTTEAPTTTTTPQPVERRFEKQPGELIGVLKLPTLCAEVQVLQYDYQETKDEVVGTGAAVLDRLTLDPTPDPDCKNVQEYAAQHPDFKMRSQWVRNSAKGSVNKWQPIAGMPRLPEGPLSVYPGQPGNAVIPGHGSTFSGPFANTAALKVGDPVIFERVDGAVDVFRIVETNVLTTDFNAIYNYTNAQSDSTLTGYNCSSLDGKTGSDATRSLWRAVKVDELA